MVKILLVHNGGDAASCLQNKLSESIQVELHTARSVAEAKVRCHGYESEIILIPLPDAADPQIHTVQQWQVQCKSEGLRPGFLFFALIDNSLTFFDISYGSFAIPLTKSDAGSQIVSSMRQVSGRSRVERSLRDDYDHHNQIISSMPLSCLDVHERIIKRANSHFTRLSGYDEDDLLGKSLDFFFSIGDDREWGEIIQLLYQQKCIEAAIQDKNGQYIPCRVTLESKEPGMPGDGLWFIEDRREYAAINSAFRDRI